MEDVSQQSEILSLEALVESVLFAYGEPVTFRKLAAIVECEENEVREAVTVLRNRLATHGSGLALIEKGDEIQLVTHPESAFYVEKLLGAEEKPTLSHSALETLALIAYRGPMTRSEIDAVRGVNSSFALRNLLVRGLVEKKEHETDSRTFVYSPTFLCLATLGVSSLAELPEYEAFSHSQRISDTQQQSTQS